MRGYLTRLGEKFQGKMREAAPSTRRASPNGADNASGVDHNPACPPQIKRVFHLQ